MKFNYSLHWQEERIIRKDITDDIMEFCILNSQKMKDKEKVIKIITSYWLD